MNISFQKTWRSGVRFATLHKIWASVIAVAVVFVGWQAYARVSAAPQAPSYALAQAQTGTLIVSVTGTGQVSASNQLSITPQISGKVTYIGVKDGATVKQGALIAEIDATDAQQQVTNAESSLKSAQLNLEKLTEPATALSLAQAQDDLANAKNSLTTAYSGATADLANTFLDLPSIMSGLEDIDFGTETNHSMQWNIDYYENSIAKSDASSAQIYRNQAYNDYQTAKTAYDAVFNDYKSVNLATADATTTQQLLSTTYSAVQKVMDAVKSANALIQFYSDQLTADNLTTPAIATTQLSNLSSYTSKLSTHSSELLSDTNTITTDKQSINEKNLSLQQLQNGPDSLDVQSSELAVENAQNALQGAQRTLAEYYVTAPFSGTVALDVTPYEQVGAGTALATMVTPDKIAEITLNEVDAAKVKVGDQVMLTFDAIPDLTIAGSIADVSPVGTVSQGVVSYPVKIDFATQDPRIKAGMSVSATIDTSVTPNALLVPSSAIHTSSDGSNYVLTFNPALTANTSQSITTTRVPTQVPVTIGLSNDTSTQILAGIKEGEQIVTRVSTSESTAPPSQVSAPSLFGGARGAGGGTGRNAVFIQK